MSQNFINLDTQKLISKVLNNIPTHRESPKSVEEIVSSVIATVDISHETALALRFQHLLFSIYLTFSTGVTIHVKSKPKYRIIF